ncbi:MAG: hypothetical protein K2M19_03790 [Muribaculaceae bacterium]|nr:hypothetical protein [Muribaculaceae bacterium]
MNLSELKKEIARIVREVDDSVDERLEKALALCPEEDEADAVEKDIIIYSALVDLLWRECPDHSRDLTLLQLYALLAEAYDDADDYRAMEAVAQGVLRLMRDRMTPADVYRETIPRIAAAIGNSVYNHALYEILLLYVKCVLAEMPEDVLVKPHVKKLLKLHLLLEYSEWREREWSKDFQNQMSMLFSAEELMHIIANPKIGHLRRDPVEYTRAWEDIYYDVEDELTTRFQNAPRQRGLCHHIWSVKRELLKDQYGIDWRSPAQMNSRVRFD